MPADDAQHDLPLAVILAVDESYQLFSGEEYLDDILMTGQNYPLPVRCLRFASALHMSLFLNDQPEDPGAMWRINPDIIARLRRDGHLEEVAFNPGEQA